MKWKFCAAKNEIFETKTENERNQKEISKWVSRISNKSTLLDSSNVGLPHIGKA